MRLALILMLLGATALASPILSLEEALSLVGGVGEVRQWQTRMDSVQESIDLLLGRYALQLAVGGSRVVEYTYDLENQSWRLTAAPSVSLSKSTQHGTTLRAGASTSREFSQGVGRTSWSLGLIQSLWPAPRYSPDQVSLEHLRREQAVLVSMADPQYLSARLKIEGLYRGAQFAQAAIAPAQIELDQAIRDLQTAGDRVSLGEGSELELIGARLELLRKERGLDQAKESARRALEALAEALGIARGFTLEELDLTSFVPMEYQIDPEAIWVLSQERSVALGQREAEIGKTRLDLQVAQQAYKPSVELSLTLTGSDDPLLRDQVGALLSFSLPILDGNQRRIRVSQRQSGVEQATQAYQAELEGLQRRVNAAIEEFGRMQRDLLIAGLTREKARIEWERAQQQWESGLIQARARDRYWLAYQQAQLSYGEQVHQVNLYYQRLTWGLIP